MIQPLFNTHHHPSHFQVVLARLKVVGTILPKPWESSTSMEWRRPRKLSLHLRWIQNYESLLLCQSQPRRCVLLLSEQTMAPDAKEDDEGIEFLWYEP